MVVFHACCNVQIKLLRACPSAFGKEVFGYCTRSCRFCFYSLGEDLFECEEATTVVDAGDARVACPLEFSLRSNFFPSFLGFFPTNLLKQAKSHTQAV